MAICLVKLLDSFDLRPFAGGRVLSSDTDTVGGFSDNEYVPRVRSAGSSNRRSMNRNR